jgi:hypothetical protein
VQEKRQRQMHPEMTSARLSPAEIGTNLARDFVHAQWLRIRLNPGVAMATDEMNAWCPFPRMRFRAPPWWPSHDLVINDDETLFAIYRRFGLQLTEIARTSDDPALNSSISAAKDHLDRVLGSDANPETPKDTIECRNAATGNFPKGFGHSFTGAPTPSIEKGRSS